MSATAENEPEAAAIAADAATDDQTKGQAEAGEGADEGPSAEDRAMAMGWTPKSQFKGDPERWVDAETFVKRGEEFLPFLKANNRRLEQALERTRADLKQLADHHSKTAAREYQRALNDIQARLDEAAANGDVQGVREATDELVEFSKESPAAVPAGGSAEFDAWRADNDWYGTDKPLSAAFDALCTVVFEEGYRTPKAGLKEAMSRLREDFPTKFAKAENPNRRQAAAVEGGGNAPRRAGKSRSDLPADARGFMDRMVKQGLMTEAEYLKDFFS